MQPKKKGVLSKLANMVPMLREVRQLRSELRQLRDDFTLHAATMRMVHLQHYLEVELPKDPRFQDSKRLQRHSFSANSQNGEDGIIREIFRRLGATGRVFVEIGIGDGTSNNTAFLITDGWTGYWIDGADGFIAKAQRKGLDRHVRCLSSMVTRENVNSLLQQLGVPKEFDLFSLDIDFNTYYIWEALTTYRPRVVVVEYNSRLPADCDWKVRYDASALWDGSWNFGASLKAYELLGAQLGYKLVGCDIHGTNAFFVRDDLVGDKFAAPFTAENHFEPSRLAIAWHKRGQAAWFDRAG